MTFQRRINAFFLLIGLLLTNCIPVLAVERDRELRVMTYNMYLGTGFDDIFAAQTPEVLVAEVAEAYANVQSGFPAERISAIADQIEFGQPSLVGLQEVALWQIGAPFDPTPATNVTYDFLQILLDELAERGLHYSAIVTQTNFDAEVPAVFSQTLAFDVRFRDRVVILARTDLATSQFKLEGTDSGTFTTSLSFTTPTLGNITVPRGWTSADVKMRGKTYRFVNAHLEAFSPIINFIQANELVGDLADTTMPVILVGDFNSDAETNAASYTAIVNGGFSDAWSATNPAVSGFTWPLSNEDPSDLVNPTQRLDLIMVRGAITPASSDVVGEETGDLTLSDLSPSDHAGVSATVVLEP